MRNRSAQILCIKCGLPIQPQEQLQNEPLEHLQITGETDLQEEPLEPGLQLQETQPLEEAPPAPASSTFFQAAILAGSFLIFVVLLWANLRAEQPTLEHPITNDTAFDAPPGP